MGDANSEQSDQLSRWTQWDEKQLWIITALTAAAYFLFSVMSDGFYQHDEAGHFISMRNFWYEPNSILGNWAKPGFKLLYAIPALLGRHAVTATNVIIAAMTAQLVYRIAADRKFQFPAIAFFLMALQPLWIQLAHRNYSEIISAFLLILVVFLHYRNKYWLAAAVLSYITLIRQEVYILLVLYAIFLLYRKQWIPFLLLGLFPIVNNVWGWMATGDPIYLITNTLKTGGTYQDAYPRQGFWHYFRMSIVIFGPVVIPLVVYNILLNVRRKIAFLWPVWAPLLVIFSVHALFNLKAFMIGASTGGNLRYMLMISPMMALLAAQGISFQLKSISKELLVSGGLALMLVVVGAFMTYDHNFVKLTNQRDWWPLILALGTVIMILFVNNNTYRLILTLALLLITLPVALKPFKLTSEDLIMKRVAEWAEQTNAMQRPILSQHILLQYYLETPRGAFPKGNETVIFENVKEAPVGTLIFWDSHYSYRPNLRETSLPPSYFMENSSAFRPVEQFVNQNRSFGVLVFEKIAGEVPQPPSPEEVQRRRMQQRRQQQGN